MKEKSSYDDTTDDVPAPGRTCTQAAAVAKLLEAFCRWSRANHPHRRGSRCRQKPPPDRTETRCAHIGLLPLARELLRVRLSVALCPFHLSSSFPHLTGTPSPDSAYERQRLFEAMWSFLDRQASNSPVLFVMEDLHWSDASSRGLLHFLARRVVDMRMLFALSYRLDEAPVPHPLARTAGARAPCKRDPC